MLIKSVRQARDGMKRSRGVEPLDGGKSPDLLRKLARVMWVSVACILLSGGSVQANARQAPAEDGKQNASNLMERVGSLRAKATAQGSPLTGLYQRAKEQVAQWNNWGNWGNG